MRNRRESSIKEYFIEFIIVILGISIAFWLSNLGDERKERRLEEQYIIYLKEDLSNDKLHLSSSIASNQKKLNALGKAIQFFQGTNNGLTYDSMPTYAGLIGSYNYFEPNENTYVTLQQSGDLKVLKDKDFKKALVDLYRSYEIIQQEHLNLSSALDDNFYPLFMSNYDLINNKIIDIEYFKTPLFRNFVAFTMNETSILNQYYEHAQLRIEKILLMLD